MKKELVNSTLLRLQALGFEANHRNVADMWRVREGQPVIPRLAKTALGASLRHGSGQKVAYKLLARQFGVKGEILGVGGEQLVMGQDATVTKLVLGSLILDSEETEAYAQKLEAENLQMAAGLGRHWLDTRFDVVYGKDDTSVVIGTQERLRDVHFYSQAQQISASPASAELAHMALELHAEVGLLPDTRGDRNIINRVGELCFIDTIPVTPERQSETDPTTGISIGSAIIRELERWQAA